MAGQPLMERAGLSAATLARDMLADRRARVLVLAGPGNNGGDAFVVARHLASWFFDVVVCALDGAARMPAEAAAARAAWRERGGTIVSDWSGDREFGLIVDGLFGIGLARAIDELHARWIVQANDSRIPILALDVPSGLDAETGVAQARTIRAARHGDFHRLEARPVDPGWTRLLRRDQRASPRRCRQRHAARQPARGSTGRCCALRCRKCFCVRAATRIRGLTARWASSAAAKGWWVRRCWRRVPRCIWARAKCSWASPRPIDRRSIGSSLS